MPTEDRGNHEKRQDKKRRNIQQTKYQNWNRRQNTEQTATILWTSESDEERTIPQNSIQRMCTWNQKEGKTKEKMDRHDPRTASDTTGGHMQDAGQESVESNHRRAADACNSIAWAIIIIITITITITLTYTLGENGWIS